MRGGEGRGGREREERQSTHQTLGTRIVVEGILSVCSISLPVVYRLISNSPTHSLHVLPKSLQNPNGLFLGVSAENSYNEVGSERREGMKGGRE